MDMDARDLILLVDDEEMITEMTASVLANYGYRVMTAASGMEAVNLCSQSEEKVSLALVDMRMPGMDGAETVRALKELRPDARFILISGFPPNDSRAGNFDGSTSFLNKPFTLDELVGAVQTSLALPRFSPQPEVKSRHDFGFVTA